MIIHYGGHTYELNKDGAKDLVLALESGKRIINWNSYAIHKGIALDCNNLPVDKILDTVRTAFDILPKSKSLTQIKRGGFFKMLNGSCNGKTFMRIYVGQEIVGDPVLILGVDKYGSVIVFPGDAPVEESNIGAWQGEKS